MGILFCITAETRFCLYDVVFPQQVVGLQQLWLHLASARKKCAANDCSQKEREKTVVGLHDSLENFCKCTISFLKYVSLLMEYVYGDGMKNC